MRIGKLSSYFGLVALLAVIGCGGAAEHAPDQETPAFELGAEVEIDPLTLLPNAKQPEEGLLLGGQPTVEQLEQAREAGFKTVINMRGLDEPGVAKDEVEALGMTYVAIPVAGQAGISEENAQALATALEEAEGPVIVHCGSGNRVGAIFAAKAYFLDGMTADEAVAVGLEYGMTRLEPVVRAMLAQPEEAAVAVQ